MSLSASDYGDFTRITALYKLYYLLTYIVLELGEKFRPGDSTKSGSWTPWNTEYQEDLAYHAFAIP